MDAQTPQQQLAERLKTANNILVTVGSNPSVDQLAACIGLTLLLNKQGKHATAVFSGDVPSTLEFLKPDETLEKNTDSLRDFIISLDKSKADKLRYKVEDRVVKIFITPYRTSLSADDLEFSQGDFNVDVVITLGVKEQQELDNAITSHGRILHDATVASIGTQSETGLGSINWHDAQASSLCELVVDLGKLLSKDLLDNQIATALLTGIVAETERFSNAKTTPQTMSISAELMKAGANQQLVAASLEGPSVNLHTDEEPGSEGDNQDLPDEAPAASDDGTLEITHPHTVEETPVENQKDKSEGTSEGEDTNQSHLVNEDKASKLITEPPILGVQPLTANAMPEAYDQSTDPLSLPSVQQEDAPALLSHDNDGPVPSSPVPQPAPASVPEAPAAPEAPSPTGSPLWTPPAWVSNTPPEPSPAPAATPVPERAAVSPDLNAPAPMAMPEPPPANDTSAIEPAPVETLAQLEQDVGSAHAQGTEDSPNLDAARDEVLSALNSAPGPVPAPVQALNAQPIDLKTPSPEEPAPIEPEVTTPETAPAPTTTFDPTTFGVMNDPDVPAAPTPVEPPQDLSQPLGPTMTMPLPPTPAVAPAPQAAPTVNDPTAPPPVPPPLPFQFGQNTNQK